MTVDRILKYCQKRIDAEQSANSLFASEKVTAYQEILDFINTTDAPKGNELALIIEIFNHHYSLHMAKGSDSKKLLKVNFTKREERKIKNVLIPQIKQELATNYSEYPDMTVASFFELFMKNLPDFWKTNAFSLPTITNKFNDIHTQIINAKKYGNRQQGSRNNKPTAAEVLADLTPSGAGNQP